MKKIVCLGCSPAAVKAIETLKVNKADISATIISLDGFYPFNRSLFSKLIAKDQDTSGIYYKHKEFYEQNGIDVILDKKISRINFNRKVIFTEEKEQIGYDVLFICDFPNSKWPKAKGTSKNNIHSLTKLKAIHEIYDALPIFESVVIQSNRLQGLAVALAAAQHGKDITLLTQEESLLPKYLTKEASANLIENLEEKGVNVFTQDEIIELLGEGDAKAVRLKQNKVIASDITIFADAMPDAKLVADSALATNINILVDDNQQSSLADVYAFDLACQKAEQEPTLNKSLANLENEGIAAARHILEVEIPSNEVRAEQSIEIDGFSLIILGTPDSGGTTKTYFDPSKSVFKQLFLKEGVPNAAVLVNAADKKELFLQILNGEIDLAQCEGEFISPEPVEEKPEGDLVEQAASNEGAASEEASKQVAEGEHLRDKTP